MEGGHRAAIRADHFVEEPALESVVRFAGAPAVCRRIAGRLVAAVLAALGVSVIVFIATKLTPGDPVSAVAGLHATPETRALIVEKYGLDRSQPEQYLLWLRRLVDGELGDSIARHARVSSLIGDAVGNTLVLAGTASVIAIVIGAALGATMSFARSRGIRLTASALSVGAVSVPQYSLGIVLIVVFSAQLAWFPAGGMTEVLEPDSLMSLVHHLVLPALTASAVAAGIIARVFSSALDEEKNCGYTENLRARGLPEWRIRLTVVRAALAPLLTISGLQIGYLFGGVIYVEVVFAWPGLGQLIYQSISRRDYPVIQAGVLTAALFFILVNLAVDLLRPLADPRLSSEVAA